MCRIQFLGGHLFSMAFYRKPQTFFPELRAGGPTPRGAAVDLDDGGGGGVQYLVPAQFFTIFSVMKDYTIMQC